MKQVNHEVNSATMKPGFILDGIEVEAETVAEQRLIQEIEELREHLAEKNAKLRKANDKLKELKTGSMLSFDEADLDVVREVAGAAKLLGMKVEIEKLDGKYLIKASWTVDATNVLDDEDN